MIETIVIPLVQNIGVLALLAVGIARLNTSDTLSDMPVIMRQLLIGVAFGLAVIVVMATPVELRPGVVFDTHAGLLLTAGLFGGPLAGLITGVIAMYARYEIGGIGQYTGVTAAGVLAVVGIVAHVYVTRRGRRLSIGELAVYAVVSTALILPTFFLLPDIDMAIGLLGTVTPIVFSSSLLAVLILGFLFEMDIRRRELEADLRRSEVEARQAADAKSRFLAAMSHEVRTPMNGVVGFTALLDGTALNAFQRRCTEQIGAAATSLLRIIDDIVDYARIDTAGVEIEVSDTNPRELLARCVEALRRQAEGKRLDIALDLAESLPGGVLVDSDRLRQAVVNILENAIKFTDRGHVTMAAAWEPAGAEGTGVLVIEIHDTGIGVSHEDQVHLFQPFGQGSHIGRGGIGLGLVVSRALIEAMGGSIEMASTPRIGTRVTLRVPTAVTRAVTASRPAPVRMRENTDRIRILVVEDVAMNAEVLEALLVREGYRVTVAENGAEAVAAMRGEAYDLVLMDLQMPVMNGLDATRTIRALPTLASTVPILALTAYASREDLRQCLDAGMNDFLTKPIDRPKLFEAIHRWCSVDDRAAADAEPSGNTSIEAADILVFDRSRIDELNAVLPAGRADGFVAESVARVRNILADLAKTEDRQQIEDLTHQLTTTAGTIGLNALRDHARQVMHAALAAETTMLATLLGELAEIGRRSIEAIETERVVSG
ncbi:MAG: response regulator [Alphaproteobacteria bacterium]|nr:response regulator [Alphaproteobacteria bacterium]